MTPTAKELFLAEVSAYGLPNRHIEMWKACEAVAKAIRDLCETPPISDAILNLGVWEIGLETRAANALNVNGIKNVRTLLTKNDDDLLKLKNLGRKGLRDIKNTLVRIGARQFGDGAK